MRLGFFLREAIRAMRRNAAPSFAALLTVLVTMLVLGVCVPLVQGMNHEANQVRQRLIVDVYLQKWATTADQARVRAELLRAPHVRSVQFESKQQAYQYELQTDPTGGWQLLGDNPLPDTFHVYPDDPSNVLKLRSALTHGGQPIDGAIRSVSNKKQDTRKVLEFTWAINVGGLGFAVLLMLASVLLIANTIRLSLYARRREVEVMKLVGATDWFIRWPFVIEGVIVGATGGVLAIALLGVVKVALLDPVVSGSTLFSEFKTTPFPLLTAILLAASAAVSAVGSGLSLRRFLRI